jgi:hypothetical protein
LRPDLADRFVNDVLQLLWVVIGIAGFYVLDGAMKYTPSVDKRLYTYLKRAIRHFEVKLEGN